jgi:hypothetical protein
MLTPVSGSEFLPFDFTEVKNIEPNKAYPVNWGKLKDVNDLVFILACLGVAFPFNHPQIETLKPFLDLNNPIPLDLTQQPKF